MSRQQITQFKKKIEKISYSKLNRWHYFIIGFFACLLLQAIIVLVVPELRRQFPYAARRFGMAFRSSENIPSINPGIPVPRGFDVHGIDISHHNGKVDWQMVAKMQVVDTTKLAFAFIKATEGGDHLDSKFTYNWNEAAKAKLIRGAYHFFSPTRNVYDQALFYVNNVILLKGDLAPVIDVEVRGNLSDLELKERVLKISSLFENHYGLKPIIYTSYSMYIDIFSDSRFAKNPLWIAHYSDNSDIHDQQFWKFWQYSQSGLVKGVKGKVDFNVFNGSIDQLRLMTRK